MPDKLNETDYDLVIIGAGIHGAAVACEASKDQLRVLLLEQFDKPAQGTSSKSSKLIHGGLRYLEHFEFGMVYECLSDRKRLLKKYPDIVELKKFYIPVYQSTTRSSMLIRTGLSLYALLGGLIKSSRFKRLSRWQWDTLDGLKTSELKNVFHYFDAQTDDVKLTTRLLEEATSSGASIEYESELINCDINETDVQISYQKDNALRNVTASLLINAAGPWVNHIVQRCHPAFDPVDIDLVSGTHIEIPGTLDKGIFYLEAPQDQRAVFAMPWKGHILVGTTERIYEGDPGKVEPSDDEIHYLLEVYLHYFPDARISKSDILDSWAGLRVLPKNKANPFKRSRETIFHKNNHENPRVISIYGGKLTSHYSTARKLLKLIS